LANYKIRGADQKEYGPINAERLRQWIGEGRLNAQSQIQAEGTSEWRPLSSFTEFADALAAPPQRLAAGAIPPMMPTTRTPLKNSGLAVTSLVMGILGFFTCGITAIPGVILGIVALNKIRKSDGQLGGKVMAIVGLCLSAASLIMLILAGLLLPAVARAKRNAQPFPNWGQSQTIHCVNNLKQLGLAVRLYANDNKDQFPLAAKWCDAIQTDVGGNTTIFQCPGAPGPRCTYAFNAKISGMDVGKINPNTVMIFETQGGWNLNGGAELMIRKPRHGNRFTVCLADGSVQQITASQLSELNWEP